MKTIKQISINKSTIQKKVITEYLEESIKKSQRKRKKIKFSIKPNPETI